MKYALLILLVAAGAARAGVPDVVTYAGTLKQGAQSADGTFSVVATLFNDPDAGTNRFQDTFPTLDVVDGNLILDLGADPNNPLDDSILADGNLFLEVSVNGETLSPRVPLSSVPYARVARRAENVAGLDVAGITALHSADPNGGLVDNAGAFGIADDGVTSARIADGTIAAADIADHAVTLAKIDTVNHSTALFLVPAGVDFCPGFTANTVVVSPTCQSVTENNANCLAEQPLPTGCVCVPSGASSSSVFCNFSASFLGLALK